MPSIPGYWIPAEYDVPESGAAGVLAALERCHEPVWVVGGLDGDPSRLGVAFGGHVSASPVARQLSAPRPAAAGPRRVARRPHVLRRARDPVRLRHRRDGHRDRLGGAGLRRQLRRLPGVLRRRRPEPGTGRTRPRHHHPPADRPPRRRLGREPDSLAGSARARRRPRGRLPAPRRQPHRGLGLHEPLARHRPLCGDGAVLRYLRTDSSARTA